MIIECKNIVKNYGQFAAIDGVSLQIKHGECYGLLGPNGAGKSTLINMIYGATSRSEGDMSVFGMDPMRESRNIKKKLGVVTQENYLDVNTTVLENMLIYASFVGIPSKLRRSRVMELLEWMSLSHKADEKIKTLAGGMKRRLVFVRALLSDPEFLILDEPTTGLDPAVRHVIWEKINKLKNNNTTILLTTHYMDEAERLCDWLVIMDQGKIKARGHPKLLIKQHCPGYVASFYQEPQLLGKIQSLADKHSELVFFEDSSGGSLRAPNINILNEHIQNLRSKPILLRPSNLEDVFFKVTGKELSSDA